MKKNFLKTLAPFLLISSFTAFSNEKIVNIYSLRQPELLNPVLDAFTEKTGVKVNVSWVKDGVLARIKAEGDNSPADAVISVGVNRLDEIAKVGYFKAIPSDILSNVNKEFYDEDRLWTALTLRTRIIMTSKGLKDKPKNYLDLEKPKYKGMICVRPMSHSYNVGLVSTMISHYGEERTKSWLKGLKNNFARRPSGNDRAQAKGIYEGVCKIALMNSYYLGKMATNNKKLEQKEWYNSLNIVQPGEDEFGAHANISGFGILKSSKNKQEVESLLRFMLSVDAQSIYASTNFELPIIEGVSVSPLIESWGDVSVDNLSLKEISTNTSKAINLIDELRLDF